MQRLQIKPDRSERGLQLVSHGVEKTVLFLVTPDFTDQENRVEDHPGNHDAEKYDAEDQRPQLAPVEHNPTDVQRDRHRDHARTECDEERNRFAAAGNAHALES